MMMRLLYMINAPEKVVQHGKMPFLVSHVLFAVTFFF